MESFHVSRWHYFFGYLLCLGFLGFSVWLYFSEFKIAGYVFAGCFLVFFLVLEFLIRLRVLKISDSEVSLREGIFSRRIKHIHYSDITDTGVHQNFVQRILRFGNIGINTAGTQAVEVVARSVVNPVKVETLIRSHIGRHRVKH